MAITPTELRYAATHEWARAEDDGSIAVGISDHAQESLGDVVYVELPEAGATVSAGDQAGVVESVKAASDIYSPVSGEVVEVNVALEESPETVNADPYEDGWLFRVKPTDDDLSHLLDAAAYDALCEDE
ncbi:MAG: glycine cleavage system protein GcvH [Pseudomonadales bacterium]